MNPDYYVCEICGSTVDDKPKEPCDICNYPLSPYKKLNWPILLTNLKGVRSLRDSSRL